MSLNEGLKQIGEQAFADCRKLSVVDIPSSVRSVGRKAFEDCDRLSRIYFFCDAPEGLYDAKMIQPGRTMYYGRDYAANFEPIIESKGYGPGVAMDSLPGEGYVVWCCEEDERYCAVRCVLDPNASDVEVIIPGIVSGRTVERIAEGVLTEEDYVRIRSVIIPQGVEIADGVMRSLIETEKLMYQQDGIGWHFNELGEVWPCGECKGNVRVPSSCYGITVVGIAEAAFAGNDELQGVTFPETLKYVGKDAFENCTGLTDLIIPEGLLSLGESAFSNCCQIVSASLPLSLEEVGENCFSKCQNLREVTVPTHIEPLWMMFPDAYHLLTSVSIAQGEECVTEGVFEGCVALKDFVWPNTALEIPDATFKDCIALERVTFPAALKTIGEDAFAGCTSLDRVDLSEGCAKIGDGAFRDCTWMQELTLGAGLTNVGAAAFANCTSLSVLIAPEGLQILGAGAFSNCWRLVSASLPVSLDEIGEDCFGNCKNLRGVSVPTHVQPLKTLFPAAYDALTSIVISEDEDRLIEGVFDGCAEVREIALPDAVTEIPAAAFRGCVSLESMAFPAAVKEIGNEAFAGCVGLTRLNLPAGLESIGARAFEGLSELEQVAIPDGVTAIGAGAFARCGAVRQVRLPGDVTTLAAAFPDAYDAIVHAEVPEGTETLTAGLFDGCAGMETFEIPEAVTNIGARTFADCGALRSVTLPQGLKAIGDEAFSGVSGIMELEIPSSVESLGAGAFMGCVALRSVTLPGDTGTLASVFPDAYALLVSVTVTPGAEILNDRFFAGCESLESVDLPTSVAAIGAGAFENCTSLAAVGIPAGVTSLGAGVFRSCSALAEVTLPGGLSVLEDEVFADCALLASVTVPESVATLGSRIFDGCTALKVVKFIGNAPQVAADAYAGTPSELVTRVATGSRGWDGIASSRALPEFWPEGTEHGIGWWDPSRFEVTFDYNDGSGMSETVEEIADTTYRLPDVDPVRSGAAFLGWWTEAVNGARITPGSRVMRTSAHTLYAHWRLFTYGVTFDANGGSGEMAGLRMTVDQPVLLPKAAFVRSDYGFAGWALTPDGEVAFADGEEVVNLSLADDDDVRLYAVWNARQWSAADYLGADGLVFAAEGDADWFPDMETSHDGCGSMRSGRIGIAEAGETLRTTMKTAVVGKGTLSFWWKVDCEGGDPESGDLYDYLEFTVNGKRPAAISPIAGSVGWTRVEISFDGQEMTRELAWTFVKDDFDETALPDIAWVDEVSWSPEAVTVSFDGGGATEGCAPEAVTAVAGAELVLPGQGTLRHGSSRFVGWTDGERVYAPGETYVFGGDDATLDAVWVAFTVADALNATNVAFTTGGDAEWAIDFETSRDGEASLRSGTVGVSQTSWVEAAFTGESKLTFALKSEGLVYRNNPANYVTYAVDNAEPVKVAVADWAVVELEIVGTGAHTVRWTYVHTRSQATGGDCAWIDQVSWTPGEAPAIVVPTIAGDAGATVTGDAEKGFVVTPSKGKTEIEVTIPDGVDAAKVTVAVATDVKTVKPNGARVMIMKGTDDIAPHLDVPVRGDGVLEVGEATVKEAVVKEALDTEKGAKVEFGSDSQGGVSPSLTTAPTKPGLVYTLHEGAALNGMNGGDSKLGDGQPWTPKISVKGGKSGFYSIGVTK